MANCLFIVLASVHVFISIVEAIVNGYNAPDRPFFVLLKAGEYTCGGTLVSPNTIVTSAYCLHGAESKPIYAYVGDFSEPGTNNKRKFQGKGFKHRGFNSENGIYDMGVVKLYNNVSFSKWLPVCPEKLVDNSTLLLTVGMGPNKHGGPMSDVLKEAQIKELPVHACMFEVYPDKEICAGDSTSVSCDNDSGSALFTVDRIGNAECLYGVFSWTGPNTPCSGDSVYGRASFYHEWIKSTV